MSRFVFCAFKIWFLTLPFTVIASIYLGVTAIDKQMAVMLISIWIVLFLFFGSYKIEPKKIFLLLIALGFFFIRNISFINHSALFASALWEDAIRFGYFSLPILYIDNQTKVKTACRLVSINAVVGCLSAFLVALGLLNLPYERLSESRLGFVNIQRSIGLMSSYGDMAQYTAYFLLLAILLPTTLVFEGKNSAGKLLKIFAVVIALMGLIGCQSRSYLLSLIVSLFIATLFYYRSKKSTKKIAYNMMLFATALVAIGMTAYFFSDIIAMLSGISGSQARGTAMTRIKQYQYAFDIIKENPILGINAAYYAKYSQYIHGIHNMWLGQLARGGLISLFAFLGLLSTTIIASLNLLGSEETKIYGIVTVGYMSAVLVSTLFYPADSPLFWALLGMNTAVVTTLR